MTRAYISAMLVVCFISILAVTILGSNPEKQEAAKVNFDEYARDIQDESDNELEKRGRNPYSWQNVLKRSRNPYAWQNVLKRDGASSFYPQVVSYLDIPPFVQEVSKRPRNPYSWQLNPAYNKRAKNPYSWMADPTSLKRSSNVVNYRSARNPYAWSNVL
uniref:Neuropeptide-Like Protein n=1 Tax=Rhabditophanes sp. KR3021 TaxID=114890 RepID=A0AC35TVR0_9BILA